MHTLRKTYVSMLSKVCSFRNKISHSFAFQYDKNPPIVM